MDHTFNIKRRLAALALTFAAMLLSLCVAAQPALAKSFPDVNSGDWFYESASRASDSGYITGYDDGRFGPNDTLTRAQAAVIICNYFGGEGSSADSPTLPDVKAGNYYTASVNWAVDHRVISGKEAADGSRYFDPDGAITRTELCAIVGNAADSLSGKDISSNGKKLAAMPDSSSVPSWGKASVAWSLDAGVISGKEAAGGSRYIAPNDVVTRAEMAAIIVNCYDNNILYDDLNPSLGDLEVDEFNFIRGEDGTATFTVTTRNVSAVTLEGNGTTYAMHDDGQAGDAQANDGVFTQQIQAGALTETETLFKATSGSLTTEQTGLYLFKPANEVTEEEITDQQNKVSDAVEAAETNHTTETGYVDPASTAEVLNALKAELATLKDQGTIVNYDVDEDGAYIKLACGVAYVYNPPIEGTNGGVGDESTGIWCYQPFPQGATNYYPNFETSISGSWRTDELLNSGSNWGWKNFDDVTFDVLDQLPSDSVILWHSHGCYSKTTGPAMEVGGEVNIFDRFSNWLGEYISEEIVIEPVKMSDGSSKDAYAVTSYYINNRVKDLSGDVILLGTCHGSQETKSWGLDTRLTDAFLNKGAKCGLAFSDTVYKGYAVAVMEYVVTYMCDNDATIQEAENQACAKYGNDDIAWATNNISGQLKSEHAWPAVFGDTGIKLDTYKNGRNVNSGLNSNTAVGDIVTFGSYEQDNDASNGKEAIKWQVLDVQDGRALLLSKCGLDCQPYQQSGSVVPWENCTLRSWLNDSFYQNAFSASEQGQVLKTSVDNSASSNAHRIEGSNTSDWVFCLSTAELSKYVAYSDRVSKATEYAAAHGAMNYGEGGSYWWLRSWVTDSPGTTGTGGAVYVFNHGYTDSCSYGPTNLSSVAIRPAIWVSL